MKKADTIVYGFTIDGYDVDRFNTSLEIFLTVFNSNEAMSCTSMAGECTYIFLTNKERNWNADAWEKQLLERRIRKRLECRNGTIIKIGDELYGAYKSDR